MLLDQWDPTSRDYIEGREDMVVNNYAQYCSVVKTGIGKAKMIIGGEVDARKYNNKWDLYVLMIAQYGIASPQIKMNQSIGLS